MSKPSRRVRHDPSDGGRHLRTAAAGLPIRGESSLDLEPISASEPVSRSIEFGIKRIQKT